jgi:riboflavin kinase / FMN adenylyltransferase
MEVYRSLEEVPAASAGRSLALGTFDGVHLGHRRVIGSALEWARARGATATVVTFDPHPLKVLRPEEPLRLLTTTEVKIDLVAELGVDEMVVIPFTEWFSRLEPEEFCDEVLVRRLSAAHLSVGANFRFGHGAAGDAELLRSRAEFETEVVPLLEYRGETVSSSRIRALVAQGAVAEARELLGAPFQLDGTVVEGAARGRELRMPTANLEPPPDVVLPAAGIYAALARVAGEEYAAATSIGVRPTFEAAGEVKLEAHLLGFEGDLYGSTVRLAFLERLRDELRFDSPEELVAQMKKDVEQTRETVARSARGA